MTRKAKTKKAALQRCLYFLLNQNHSINGSKRAFNSLEPKNKIFVIKRHLENNPRICKLISGSDSSTSANEAILSATTIILTHIINK